MSKECTERIQIVYRVYIQEYIECTKCIQTNTKCTQIAYKDCGKTIQRVYKVYCVVYKVDTKGIPKVDRAYSKFSKHQEHSTAKFTDEHYTTINQSTAGRFDLRVFVNCLQVTLYRLVCIITEMYT